MRSVIYLGLLCLLAGALAWVAACRAAEWLDALRDDDVWYEGKGYSG
jgi:hypothetical protein